MPQVAKVSAAGSGFKAALTRGVGDLSMSGAAMDETQYEFTENNESQQTLDDIDDFERRLAGGGAARSTKPLAASAAAAAKKVPIPAAAAKKSGADYVRQSAQSAPRVKKTTHPGDEDEDDADDVKEAMAAMNRFEQEHGADSDDD